MTVEDSQQFDQYVIRKTNQSAKTLFPVILNVDHPDFFKLLDECYAANDNLCQAEKEGSLNLFMKLSNYFTMASGLVKLYFLPAIETKYIWTT